MRLTRRAEPASPGAALLDKFRALHRLEARLPELEHVAASASADAHDRRKAAMLAGESVDVAELDRAAQSAASDVAACKSAVAELRQSILDGIEGARTELATTIEAERAASLAPIETQLTEIDGKIRTLNAERRTLLSSKAGIAERARMALLALEHNDVDSIFRETMAALRGDSASALKRIDGATLDRLLSGSLSLSESERGDQARRREIDAISAELEKLRDGQQSTYDAARRQNPAATDELWTQFVAAGEQVKSAALNSDVESARRQLEVMRELVSELHKVRQGAAHNI